MFSISARIFNAWARTAFRSGPMTTTSTGVGEPKLITVLTISPGSKPKENFFARVFASSGEHPSCSKTPVSHGTTCSGNTFRRRSRNA